jgi:hypothetical protein
VLFKTGSIVHKKHCGTWYWGEIIEVDVNDLDLPCFVQYEDGEEVDISHEDAVKWVTQLGEGQGQVSVAHIKELAEVANAEAAAGDAAAAGLGLRPFRPLSPTQQATKSQGAKAPPPHLPSVSPEGAQLADKLTGACCHI